MLKRNIRLFILILPVIFIAGTFIYWYFNPSIGNEDFHLQYILSDPDEDFYNVRNNTVSDDKYTYNDDKYSNDKEGYELIIHSIDFTKFGEKILIITDYPEKKFRYVNLTYKSKNEHYSPIEIVRNNDSILIYRLFEEQRNEKNLIFEGVKSDIYKTHPKPLSRGE